MLTQVFRRGALRRRLDRRVPDFTAVNRIVVMCTANRVRSPFAALYLLRRLPESVHVISRGVLPGGPGCPADAIVAGALQGLDMSRHEARTVTATELLTTDLVLTMELRMAHELAVMYPAVARCIVPLGYFDASRRVDDIFDPFMLPRAEYVKAYDLIARCCDGLLHEMGCSQAT